MPLLIMQVSNVKQYTGTEIHFFFMDHGQGMMAVDFIACVIR